VAISLLALHALCGAGVLLGARRLGRWGFALGALPLVASVLALGMRAGDVLDGRPVTGSVSWVPSLGLTLDSRVDAFSLLMVVLVCGVGSLVFAYAWSYFSHSDDGGRVAGLLTLFAGAMLGVVVADNLFFLFLCWELTSVTSYLLIGIHDRRAEARAAATHALLVTGAGGLVMLAGLVLLGQEAGTYSLSALLEAPPSGTVTSVALALVLVGAFTKSAQYPFHSWLPGAMVAPTPISSYLHSAAMVKAGVYLVARLAPSFAGTGAFRPLVVTVGLFTMVAGGLRAMRPFDLKQILAFGTISQLGFLMVLFGIGQPEATAAGCALLLSHALFKAALFMCVGVVDHQLHTRDVRALPELGHGWRGTKAVVALSAASMAAVPPLAGFIAKESAYASLVEGTGGDRLVLAVIVAGSILTVAYSCRIVAAFLRPSLLRGDGSDATAADAAGRPPTVGFVAPAMALATATVLLGLVPAIWSDLVDHASHALDLHAHAHLALWHGFNSALVLSAVTLAAGLGLFAARRWLAAAQGALAPTTTGADVYDASLRGLLAGSAKLTGVVQSGSLPTYAAVILTTAALAPTVALLTGDWWSGWPDVIGRAGQVPVAGLIVVAAMAATLATRRFVAAVMLGAVGYGTALFFVVQGAPDVALTQFGVETLSVVVFLLVLRRLPDRYEKPVPAMGQPLRIAVSAAVGAFVVLMALASYGARTSPSVSDQMVERAYPEGYGHNIVNVILVDIRGIDTLGEITVLATASVGMTALARAAKRPRRRTGRATPRAAAPTSAGAGAGSGGAGR
jgi:multicomponent Na+:H+ antiporter subunit A